MRIELHRSGKQGLTRGIALLLLTGLAASSASAVSAPSSASAATGDSPAGPPSASADSRCGQENGTEVIVCGQSPQKYRIDPSVLAAARAREATPPKPPISSEASAPCSGQECGGGTIPLIGVALTAIRAAVLASQGDDWRDAFRTHADEYRLYQEEKARNAKTGTVTIGVTVGNR